MTSKYKVIKNEFTKKGSDNSDYKITIKNEELNIEKTDYKEGQEVEVNAEVQKLGTDGKPASGESAKPVKIKGKVKRGMLSDSIEIKKGATLVGSVTLNEDVQTAVEGWNMTFHIGYSVLIALLLGLGIWWFVSSRKEDKEEESL